MDFSNIEEIKTADENQYHFYYNREERIKRAPKSVQDYYDGKMTPTKGFFKVLVSTRGNRFLLSTIIIFSAFIWLFSFLSSRTGTKIAGTSADLTAFCYADDVYVELKFDEIASSQKNVSFVPLEVTFFAIDNTGTQIDFIEIKENFTGEELFIRTKFSDYDIIKITCSIKTDFEEKTISSRIVRH